MDQLPLPVAIADQVARVASSGASADWKVETGKKAMATFSATYRQNSNLISDGATQGRYCSSPARVFYFRFLDRAPVWRRPFHETAKRIHGVALPVRRSLAGEDKALQPF